MCINGNSGPVNPAFIYDEGCIWKAANTLTLTITQDNTFEIDTTQSILDFTEVLKTSITGTFIDGDVLLFSDDQSCVTQTINVSWDGTVLTINDITNGVSETFTEGFQNTNEIVFYSSNQKAFYRFILNNTNYELVNKITCDCFWTDTIL